MSASNWANFFCGDLVIQSQFGEECDTGNDSQTTCVTARKNVSDAVRHANGPLKDPFAATVRLMIFGGDCDGNITTEICDYESGDCGMQQ